MQTASTPKLSEPPYAVGFLCLIPLVGVFVGLRLLLSGIFRYKDKWLAIIGGAGIVVSVLVYFGHIYVTDVLNTSSRLADFSQKNLNELDRNIKFYKTQRGEYPYSLEQLFENDGAASITDPMQAGNRRMNVRYNYQRTDDKYIVFSSGMDGIPNTEDDIYPQ